jgi:hypothetical protein
MDRSDRRPTRIARPRIALIGSCRDPFGMPGDGLVAALAGECDLIHIDAVSPYRAALRVYRQAAEAIRFGTELVHVLDPRFAPVAAMLAGRYGVPVSATVSARDMRSRTPLAQLSRRAIRGFDQAFTSEALAAHAIRDTMPDLAVSLVRPAARLLPPPLERHTRAVARALRGVVPGRPVLGLLWPDNRNDLRWFRDIVLPQLDASPICLIMGAPSRREVRLVVRAAGLKSEFRVVPGRLDAPMLAAVARCVDAFVSPASLRRGPGDAVTGLTLALAVGGVPVVSDGRAEAAVLAHERNAFLVDRGDERGFAGTLNRLLALPAIQRHFLGEEFARFTLSEWPWSAAAEVYAERFASLVGRPRIPADLRAA